MLLRSIFFVVRESIIESILLFLFYRVLYKVSPYQLDVCYLKIEKVLFWKEKTGVLSQDVRVSVFDILEKTERNSLDYHALKLRQFLKFRGVSV